MLRQLIPLTLAAVLLAPLAASAQTPPATPPAPPATPAPAAPPARMANRLNGRITAVDATAKTVTVTVRKKTTTLSVPDGTKIFKADDAKKDPTGTFADLTVGTRITATTDGNADTPTATVVHIRALRTAAPPAAPAAPAAPTTPAPPAAP